MSRGKEHSNKNRNQKRREWRLIARGIRLVLEISPQYFIYNILFQIGQIVSPYFSLYLSALLINELAGQCRWERLMLLAGITVLGQFGIKAVNRFVQARRNVWGIFMSTRKRYLCLTGSMGFSTNIWRIRRSPCCVRKYLPI